KTIARSAANMATEPNRPKRANFIAAGRRPSPPHKPGLNLLHRWLSDGMFFGDFHRLLLGRTIRVLAQTSAFFDRWILGGLLVAGALAARLLALAVAWLEREF
ncbi:MAG: hypothetical protein M1588_01465, partial [Planctomycetes bacterium]|nr:hypothetical protein [Planctomycetota bacterium]